MQASCSSTPDLLNIQTLSASKISAIPTRQEKAEELLLLMLPPQPVNLSFLCLLPTLTAGISSVVLRHFNHHNWDAIGN